MSTLISPATLDGVLMDAAQVSIPVTDEGVLRGDGVFEVVRVYDGQPFALEAHLARMEGSAANLRLPLDVAALRADVDVLLDAAGPVDAALRLLVTRGGRRITLLEPLATRPETLALVTIIFAPTRVLDGVKSLSYAGNMLATRLAREQGGDEALLVTPHGRVLEGPTTSFFYTLGGALHTPPLSDHILDSITRRALLSITDATERVTTRDDLAEIGEAFLASTLREVHPVHAIDGVPLAAAPGPVSLAAAAGIQAHIAAELGDAAAPDA